MTTNFLCCKSFRFMKALLYLFHAFSCLDLSQKQSTVQKHSSKTPGYHSFSFNKPLNSVGQFSNLRKCTWVGGDTAPAFLDLRILWTPVLSWAEGLHEFLCFITKPHLSCHNPFLHYCAYKSINYPFQRVWLWLPCKDGMQRRKRKDEQSHSRNEPTTDC